MLYFCITDREVHLILQGLTVMVTPPVQHSKTSKYQVIIISVSFFPWHRYRHTNYQVIIVSMSFFPWHRYSMNKIPGNNYLYVIFLMAPIQHNKIPGNNYLCHFPMAQIQHNKIPSNNDICIIFSHDTDFVTTKYQVIMISVSFSP